MLLMIVLLPKRCCSCVGVSVRWDAPREVTHVVCVQAAAEQIAQAPNEPCSNFAKTFADCMSDNNGDLEGCRYYFDKLQVLYWKCFLSPILQECFGGCDLC